jgi:SLOG family YspA-like protein
MRVIIAGSRSITDFEVVKAAIKKAGFFIDTVVSGGAVGVDKLGEKWALENATPIKRFLPDWETHGKAAGPIRNSEMVKYAEAAIICWDGISKGSKDTINKMQKAGKQVFVYVPDAD